MVETRKLNLGPRKVAVDLYGRAGPWVVLLHGAPGWRRSFRQVAEDLARNHRVAAPDLLGFGASSAAPRGSHAEAQAEMVIGLLDGLGVPEAHLVGFDYGGPAALLAWRRAPERILSLTLSATNAFPDTRIPTPLQIARLPLVGGLASRLAFGRLGQIAMWRFAAEDRRAFPLRRFLPLVVSGRTVAQTRRVLSQSLRHLDALYRDVEAALRELDVPTVVVWGAEDPILPVEVGERTARLARGKLRVLEGCGHFVPQERPKELAEEIRRLTMSMLIRPAPTPPPEPPRPEAR